MRSSIRSGERKLRSALALIVSFSVLALAAEGSASATPRVRINLSLTKPADSVGVFQRGGITRTFAVGYGKKGVSCAGERFTGGYSLLGTFEIDAILSSDTFSMAKDLAASSGRATDWLARRLFPNMSAIDFDGDGKSNEYGAGFMALRTVPPSVQPFGFNEYRGTYRFYSYALHGTNDEGRIGTRSTGGCINIGKEDLAFLLSNLVLGDVVEIRADGRFDPAGCHPAR